LKSSSQTQGTLRWTVALAALLLPAIAAHARVHKSKTWAEAQFAAAVQTQQALESRPAADRTRRDYERVIDAYRRIYLGAPSSGRADPSVVAAAQMLEEMGRRFKDPDVLREAIQQYEFLRREYPGSKFRFDALFRIGEIYKDDLHDKTRADATFEEFLHRYPRNQFAEAARQALAEPVQQQASLKSKFASKAATKDSKEPQTSSDSEDNPAPDDSNNETDAAAEASSGKPSRVLAIRHWSTPDYTRVAIDLEQGVKYESQRIDHPDRVFFDLLNAKLDPKLAGKTFDVSDGLLKDIRTSQYKAERTRVVLDLAELSEFDASLQSNPPRLIIDIHNADAHKSITTQPAAKAPVVKEVVSSGEVTREETPSNLIVDDSVTSADELPAKTSSARTSRPNTVVVSNGVKKTVVDADDDEAVARSKSKTKDTVATLDAPETNSAKNDLAKITPTSASTIPTVPSTSDHAKSGTAKGKRKTPTTDLDVREAQPTASGERSLTRALGLKIGKIVIDPGHGGHDTGTIGPNGLEEKDLVLDVSRRLGKLLQTRLGAEVIYTRKDDTFIPLETRTAIANEEAADLFVSVHANSSHDPDARGVETYYLNFTSSPEALEVAARENAVSEKSIHELQDLVKKIALKEKIDESQEFASDVQRSLHSGLAAKNPGLRDRGVKKAPFIVLIGANMPSILAEISFVSNPGDERRLETADYRQKIAESLYRGVAKYVSGLSGVKVASKIDKSAGQ
jgi:N-acetylmuramoyl-L-alanine amidase